MNTDTNTAVNLALKKLKGIKPKGVKQKNNSYLENLIDIGNEFCTAAKEITQLFRWGTNKLQMAEYKNLFNKLIFGQKFDESTLHDWILSTYQNLNKDESLEPGIFSGLLLTELTKRKHEDNKLSVFYFNGDNKKLDNLFYFVEQIDVLVLKDLKGSDVGYYAGSGKSGNLGLVAGINISGGGIFSHLQFKDSDCKGLLAFNVSGHSLTNIDTGVGFKGVVPFTPASRFVFLPKRYNMAQCVFYLSLGGLGVSESELNQMSAEEVLSKYSLSRLEEKTWKQKKGALMFDLLRSLSKENTNADHTLNQIVNIAQETYRVGINYEC